MRCASHTGAGSSGPVPPTDYQRELAAMNRRRAVLFQRLRRAGHSVDAALAVVNGAEGCRACAGARAAAKPGDRGWCAACDREWRVPLFGAAERCVLIASDRVVDQQEPGGLLDRLDRAAAKGGAA
jgi:hypothetical protein